ncbi:MAG: signal peptidase I [Faecousia sp.]
MHKKENKGTPAAGFCARLGTFLLLLVIAACIPFTLPRLLGHRVYAVISGSMEPAISVGDLVYVRQTEPEDVEKNDVIAFCAAEASGAIILHRVVENRTVDGFFITKGDANAQPDLSPVSYDRLLGIAERTIPHLGQLGLILSGTRGRLAAVGLVLAAVMLHAVSAGLRAREESSQKQ